MDGVAALRFLAHHEHGFSELAVRGAGNDCGNFLWLDVAKERLDFRVNVGACGRGCNVAFTVPDRIASGAERKFETGSGRDGVGHAEDVEPAPLPEVVLAEDFAPIVAIVNDAADGVAQRSDRAVQGAASLAAQVRVDLDFHIRPGLGDQVAERFEDERLVALGVNLHKTNLGD